MVLVMIAICGTPNDANIPIILLAPQVDILVNI